jgi:hypothetical protein
LKFSWISSKIVSSIINGIVKRLRPWVAMTRAEAIDPSSRTRPARTVATVPESMAASIKRISVMVIGRSSVSAGHGNDDQAGELSCGNRLEHQGDGDGDGDEDHKGPADDVVA